MNYLSKKALIYCRVSTKEQVKEGNSLATQERICREYAIKHGFEVAGVFVDQGESAKTTDRPEWKNLIRFCTTKKNGVRAIIAYKIDRISRNVDDYSKIRVLLKNYGIEIRSTSENFENTPIGRFMENLMSNVSQFDNDVRTERCVGGMKEAMRMGRYVWKAPFGYDNVRSIGEKATIAPNDKATTVSNVFDEVAKMQKSPFTVYNEVKDKLRQSKGGDMSFEQFRKMLRNKVYAGWIIKFGETHRGAYPAIVSDEIFNQVQRILAGKQRSNRIYITDREEFPLRRFIKNPTGIKLTGSWSKGEYKRYPYYLFRMHGRSYKTQALHALFKDLLDSYSYIPLDLTKLKQKLRQKVTAKINTGKQEANKLAADIVELKQKQSLLIDKGLIGVIQDDILKEKIDELQVQICHKTALQASLSNCFNETDFHDVVRKASLLLKSPSEIWEKAPIKWKIRIQEFYFPQGLIFDGEKLQTPEICCLFKVKSSFSRQESTKVDLSKKISNGPDLVASPSNFQSEENYSDTATWMRIADELTSLSSIFDGLKSRPPADQQKKPSDKLMAHDGTTETSFATT